MRQQIGHKFGSNLVTNFAKKQKVPYYKCDKHVFIVYVSFINTVYRGSRVFGRDGLAHQIWIAQMGHMGRVKAENR